MGAVLDDRHSFLPASAFLKINVDFQRDGRHVCPAHAFPNNQQLWKRTEFRFLVIQIAIRVMVLWRSEVKIAFWLQKHAARTPICSQNANLQPKRQFAARTPIQRNKVYCSPNANSLPIASLQPKRQLAAQTPVRCRSAAQTPIRCRTPVCSPIANLQPNCQFAANLQPKRQFAAERQFAA